MKQVSAFLLFIILNSFVFAQHKHKPVFNSYTAGGLVIGQSAPSGVAETVNGIKYANWFVGAGVAYHGYQYQSIPVYADAKYSFGKKKQYFVLGDIGYNTASITTSADDKNYLGLREVKYKGGIYLQSGIGCILQPSKKHSFYFQLDYGKKQLSKIVKEWTMADLLSDLWRDGTYYTYKYDLKTVDIKIGFKF